jgi:hypothetical protein
LQVTQLAQQNLTAETRRRGEELTRNALNTHPLGSSCRRSLLSVFISGEVLLLDYGDAAR